MNIAGLSIAAALVTVAAGTAPAMAETQLFRSDTAQTGKPARLYVLPALKKDCSQGSAGDIKVVAPPKNGTLAVKQGKLKTPASYRCPNVETQVSAVFYQSNPKFTGSDEVVLEAKTPDGEVQKTTIRITVSDKPAEAAKKDELKL